MLHTPAPVPPRQAFRLVGLATDTAPGVTPALIVPATWRGWLKWDLDAWSRALREVSPAQWASRSPFLDPAWCTAQLSAHAVARGAAAYAGGYGEDRAVLWHGTYLARERAVHLGVDWMAPAGTPVALRGRGRAVVVEAWHDPDQTGGWGGRLVLDDGSSHWLVLAHLALSAHLAAGTEIVVAPERPTLPVGTLADADRNGGWFPHLHVQRIPRGADLRALDGYGSRAEWISGAYPAPTDLYGAMVRVDGAAPTRGR